jgi:hypothetical protein
MAVCVKATEQEAVLAEVREEWLRIGLATGPADRPAAELGVCQAYQSVGLEPPGRFIWVDSPIGGVMAANQLGSAGGRQVQEQVADRPRLAVLDEFHRKVGGPAQTMFWRVLDSELRHQVSALAVRLRLLIERTMMSHLQQSVDDSNDGREGPLRDRPYPLHCVWGQHDAAWLAQADALHRTIPGVIGTGQLGGLMQVARSAGWWWPFAHLVILAERPAFLRRDARGRMHCADGPALVYPDGFAVWAWHGVVVPSRVIKRPEQLTVREIRDEADEVVRQVMLERLRPDRYLRHAGGEQLSSDEVGTLWSADLGDERLVMVKVLNSTPDPDGKRKAFWLRVPPHVRTAREAVAWTFGLAADSYRPIIET